MNPITAATRWLAGKRSLDEQLIAKQDELANHEANPPAGIDAAEHRRWIETRDSLRRDVEALHGALAIATANLAAAEADKARAESEAEHVAEDKAAKADEKLVREIESLAQKLAAKRDELSASIARTDAYNGRRGDRPFVVDAEKRVRTVPAKTIPATYRDEVVWKDASGRQASTFRRDARGELVPSDPSFERHVVKVCQQQERHVYAQMPTRFADSFVLVDLAGRKL